MSSKSEKNKKICFAASSGGHLDELMILTPLMKQYDSFIVTEKTGYKAFNEETKLYFLVQVNRREPLFPLWMTINFFRSLFITIRERPAAIVTTGVLAVVPLCFIIKLFGGKVIFIESFAKISSPTLTGKIIYRIADRFYVQWESMKQFYPKAICIGGIY